MGIYGAEESMAYTSSLGKIYANTEIKSFFQSEIKEGNLAHAYIIEGEAGCGKYTFARSVCADLASDERLSELIMKGGAPDIVTLAPESDKKSIGINAIRSIKQDAYIIPGELEFKAYIIRYSDLMTVQAQNALLKLLEEPPANVYFFLLCENSSLLLPTVRSRAPVVRMQLLSESEMEEYLLEVSENRGKFRAMEKNELAHVISISGGSIGKAEGISEGEEADPKAVFELFDLLAAKKSAGVYLHINSLSTKREELIKFTESFIAATRDITALKQKGNAERLFGYTERLLPFAKRFTMLQLISCYDAASDALTSLSMNLNVTNVKTTFAASLTRAVNR